MTMNGLRARAGLRSGSALSTIACVGAGLLGLTIATAAAAQEPATPATQAEEPQGDIVVTGSRIARPDVIANSPIKVVTGEQTIANADITLDTFLNTLPGVNPAGTTTSNNPPNGGQANVDLRGLGANRNLVLIDGRRAMVSASNQTVDINTIPQALIERIDVITGGAGAAYGADAVAGVVNIVTKRDFKGLDVRATYANSVPGTDAREYQLSALAGYNFADDRGNITVGGDYSKRQGLIKSQRSFSANATATTSFLPEGLYAPSGNAPNQAAIDSYFGQFGGAPGSVANGSSLIGFNLDGSLFSRGVFNNPANVLNFRYPIDTAVNANLYPDVYSYNFDAVNILTLPLERKSAFVKSRFEITDHIEAFVQGNYADYSAVTALAPTPIPTVAAESLTGTNPIRVKTGLITSGSSVTSNQLIIPVTNPFIPAAFRTLLATRTGNNAALVGTGATEPFLMRQRTLAAGLRQSVYGNEVYQIVGGLRGDVTDWLRYEASYSYGHTRIQQTQTGNIDTQRLQGLLEAADGGNSICAGGFNPFGRQPISAACLTYLQVDATLTTEFSQRIAQGYLTADLADLPAGKMTAVVGIESRKFKYDFDPGALSGPVSGFNAQNPAGGANDFTDYFGELLVPLARDTGWARSLELSLGVRASHNSVRDTVKNVDGRSGTDWSYKAELSYAPFEQMRLRGTYQRAVRAPNFSELFDGGGSNPQYFDPCSITSGLRTGSAANQAQALCAATGVGSPTAYVQTPGTQISLEVTGNTNLKPEKADTFTGGVVFSGFSGGLRRFRASVDYYNIKISDVILSPDPNLLVADCYNYFGQNANYSASNASCGFIGRAGGDILGIGGNGGNLPFPGINGGFVKTSGVDVQLSYGVDLPFVSESSALTSTLLVTRVIDYTQKDFANIPAVDYNGTVSFFGSGLGASSPKWRGNLNTSLAFTDNLSFDSRVRYIDKMVNRASRIYVGEQSFTGAKAVWYFDFTLAAKIEQLTLRFGVNNAFNRKPPTYQPNVQSGTDPSLYDVIGRRAFVSAGLKF
ncbi:TonB-dependent receptor domain-containing protein [Sphingomonas sp. 1P08PE]|uniref:TonB-dependent receptor domain-containing protein n=1 Tax=Sphingomonas sp. 1P08PE TaxID=554122 RepID=UPI0039A17C24